MIEQKPKVLILEDAPHTVKSQIAEVKRHYNAISCVMPETALKRMEKTVYDFIVIDATLPTNLLANKDGYNAGYNFYDEYVSKIQPNAKIVFWDRRTDKFFNKEKYSDNERFLFLHKTKDRYALYNALKALAKPKENTIMIDGIRLHLK